MQEFGRFIAETLKDEFVERVTFKIGINGKIGTGKTVLSKSIVESMSIDKSASERLGRNWVEEAPMAGRKTLFVYDDLYMVTGGETRASSIKTYNRAELK